MIQINNLVKKFDDFTALDGVNMNVEKGAVYGLVDPNGAGKSTLIRHITGVMRQDAGEVFIDGEPVYENARIKGQMAYIPDDMFYFLQSDTINMMHYYKGMYPNFDEKQFYRMQDVAEHFVDEFATTDDPHASDILLYKGDGKYQLNLWECNRRVLVEAGVQEDNIAISNICTCCNPSLLFSHRASHGKRGNLGAFMFLK